MVGMAKAGNFNMKMSSLKEEQKQNQKGIFIFLLITFAITYAVEIFIIMPLAASADMEQALVAQALVSSVMFIPSISALLARVITKEKFSARNLMITLNLKGNLKYYALAWFGTVLLIVLGSVIYFLIFPKQFDPGLGYLRAVLDEQAQSVGMELTDGLLWKTMITQTVMGIFMSPFLNAINCFGEEWGWRGYLLPKMLKQFKIVPTLLITGVIWGLWHMPLIIMGHNYGVGYPGYPYVGILEMCVFCVAFGIILSYVTIKTKSCIPAIMGHGVMNGFAAVGICFTSLTNPFNILLGPAPTGIIGGLGIIVVAAVLLYSLYKQEKQSPGGIWV